MYYAESLYSDEGLISVESYFRLVAQEKETELFQIFLKHKLGTETARKMGVGWREFCLS